MAASGKHSAILCHSNINDHRLQKELHIALVLLLKLCFTVLQAFDLVTHLDANVQQKEANMQSLFSWYFETETYITKNSYTGISLQSMTSWLLGFAQYLIHQLLFC